MPCNTEQTSGLCELVQWSHLLNYLQGNVAGSKGKRRRSGRGQRASQKGKASQVLAGQDRESLPLRVHACWLAGTSHCHLS